MSKEAAKLFELIYIDLKIAIETTDMYELVIKYFNTGDLLTNISVMSFLILKK